MQWPPHSRTSTEPGLIRLKSDRRWRDAAKLDRIASETGLERRAFGLDEPAAIDSALNRVLGS
jgi:hypothetical protein